MPAAAKQSAEKLICNPQGNEVEAGMRGNEQPQDAVLSYVSLEQRVPCDHRLRAIRQMVDQALRELSSHFDGLYASTGRPSIAPEKLLRALLLQAL
jgi:transposase